MFISERHADEKHTLTHIYQQQMNYLVNFSAFCFSFQFFGANGFHNVTLCVCMLYGSMTAAQAIWFPFLYINNYQFLLVVHNRERVVFEFHLIVYEIAFSRLGLHLFIWNWLWHGIRCGIRNFKQTHQCRYIFFFSLLFVMLWWSMLHRVIYYYIV